jgi:hypothetical protein
MTAGAAKGIGMVALALLCVLAPASADAKKKKKTPPAVTRTSSVPLLPGSVTATTAGCPKKTHISGGGLTVTPTYSANGSNVINGGSGTRAIDQASNPSGKKAWAAGAGAFNQPAQPGTFAAVARCESNTLGKLAATLSGSGTVAPDNSSDLVINCPGNTHVLSGGFASDPPSNLSALGQKRFEVLQSRRTAPGQWTVTGENPSGAPGPATLTGYAICEVNAKKSVVSETSVSAAIVDNGRATATATCAKKKHVVSGGFLVTPLSSGVTLPAVGIDQFQPVGSSAWQTALYEYPGFVFPPGSLLSTFAYCKPNK